MSKDHELVQTKYDETANWVTPIQCLVVRLHSFCCTYKCNIFQNKTHNRKNSIRRENRDKLICRSRRVGSRNQSWLTANSLKCPRKFARNFNQPQWCLIGSTVLSTAKSKTFPFSSAPWSLFQKLFIEQIPIFFKASNDQATRPWRCSGLRGHSTACENFWQQHTSFLSHIGESQPTEAHVCCTPNTFAGQWDFLAGGTECRSTTQRKRASWWAVWQQGVCVCVCVCVCLCVFVCLKITMKMPWSLEASLFCTQKR